MRFIHAIGYAAAGLFAGAIGSSFTAVINGTFSAGYALGFMLISAAVGAYVGWNRQGSRK